MSTFERSLIDSLTLQDDVLIIVEPNTALVTVSQADALIQERVFDTFLWNNTLDDKKYAALNEATDRVNNLAYRGEKNTLAQRNAFPRDGATTIPTNEQ